MSDNKEIIMVATELKKEFLEAADDLDKHMKNVNIARISGSSVAIVSGAVAIATGIAAFFTFGITIPIAIASAAVATSGGVTAGGASVAGYVISKSRMNRMEKMWKKFKELCGHQLYDMPETHGTFSQEASKAATVGRLIANAIQAGTGAAASTGARAAVVLLSLGGVARVAVTPARLAAALGSSVVVLNVAVLGLSIYDLVDASLEIHRKKKSPAGDILRKLAKDLDAIIQGKCTACG